MLLIGRAILGIGVGFGLAIDPIYISEVSPKHLRGRLVTCSEISINVGILIGFIVGYGLQDVANNWRWMIGCGSLLPSVIIIMIALGFMPESPRWLVMKGQTMKSRSILASINPSLDDEGLNAMLLEIDLSISEERSSYSNSNSNSGDNKLNGTPWSIFFSPPLFLKRMLVVGVLIASTQQLTGVDGVQYYMNFLLEASGITSQRSRFGVVILLGLCKLSAVVFAAPKIDSLGRRPMVLTSISGMIIGLFLLAIQLYSGIWVGLSIVGLLIFYVFFSVGLGPVCWLIPAEIFPNAIRAKAVAITTLCNRLSSTLIGERAKRASLDEVSSD